MSLETECPPEKGMYAQVNEPCFTDIGGDELGGGLDGSKEEREIARRGGTEAELVREDMAG